MFIGQDTQMTSLELWLAARNKINLRSEKEQHTIQPSRKSVTKEGPLSKVTKEKVDCLAVLLFRFILF